MNFGEMKDLCLELLGETKSTPIDFTRDEIGRFLNDAQRDFVRNTGALETQFWFEVDEGVSEYTLPDNMEMIQRVTHRDRKIAPTSVFELDRINETWEDETGEIDAYAISQRNDRVLRVYRTPEYQDKHNLGYYGVVAFVYDDSDLIVADNYQFRFASLVASLGIVVDYEVTGETVSFVAATSGGGADEDYGLVVDIVDDTDTGSYSLNTGYGVVVDVVDSAARYADDLVFEGGGESTSETEYGLVIQVWSDSDTFLFNDQEGVNRPAPTDEYGEIQWWKADSEILEVWANETPADMGADTDTTPLPQWLHLALVYAATALALGKLSSTRDVAVASAYAAMAIAWQRYTKNMAVNSTREIGRSFGQAAGAGRRIRKGPRLPGAYPRVI